MVPRSASGQTRAQPSGSRLASAWAPMWQFIYRFGPPRWSDYVRHNWIGRPLVIAAPMLWLVLFFLIPFVIVLKISVSDTLIAQPPYTPLWEWAEEFGSRTLVIKAHLRGYTELFTNSLYISSLLYSFKVAAVSTLLCLLLGYPMALGIARAPPARRNLYLMLVILPFWTSFLLRVYAWMGLLNNNGIINNLLLKIGVIHEPITMMHTDAAVYIGIVYSYLPFMILPLFTNLEKHDVTLLEAAADLGSRAMEGVSAHHAAAVGAGHRRRIDAGVHTGGGRVRDPLAARPPGPAHDRAPAVRQVLRHARLVAGECSGDRHAAAAGGADRGLPVFPEP